LRSRFEVDWNLNAALATSAVRGGAFTAAGAWARFAIQLAGAIVIARILGPREYGFAVIITIIGSSAMLLRDSGFSSAVIQRAGLTPQVASSIHYLNIILGILLAILMSVLGPTFAKAYGDPRYIQFSWILSGLFVFAGIGALPAALLARNLEFVKLTIVEVTATAISVVIGLAAALMGYGALALVLQALALGAVQAFGMYFVRPWLPGRTAPWAALRPYMAFAMNIALVQTLTYISSNAPTVMAGYFFGPRSAGLYSQANQLLVAPLQQVNGPLQRVAIPTLSRLLDSPARFTKYYRAIVFVVSISLWPAFAVLAVYAHGIIYVLFGKNWSESASIFSILAISGVAQALGYVNSWLFISTGQVRAQTAWALIARPVTLASLFVGMPWGIYGMALSYSLCSLVMVLPGFLVARRKSPLRFLDLVQPLFSPLVITIIVGSAAVGMSKLLDLSGNKEVLAVAILVAIFVYFAALFAFRSVRDQLFSFGALVRANRRK
jgi:O-antigen/teichoic acid export membrane protein